MQLVGLPVQSVLHMYRSQDNQPMGGVSARPLSSDVVAPSMFANIHTIENHFVLISVLSFTHTEEKKIRQHRVGLLQSWLILKNSLLQLHVHVRNVRMYGLYFEFKF